jgi:hypothetical protein
MNIDCEVHSCEMHNAVCGLYLRTVLRAQIGVIRDFVISLHIKRIDTDCKA